MLTPAAAKPFAFTTLMGVPADAMAGWNGEGDFPQTGIPGAALNAWNGWAKSTFQQAEVNELYWQLTKFVADQLPDGPTVRRPTAGSVREE